MKITRGLIIAILPIVAFCIAFFTVSGVESHADAESTESDQTNIEVITRPNEKDFYNILLLGEDGSEKLTDVIMIVSCDTKNKAMNVLQIPRDTYAEYTSSSYRKINAARDVLGGGQDFSAFLTETLGIRIDGYISMDVDVIAKAVDILGGVEIDVPMDMTYADPYQDLTIELEKGKQILDGEKAKQFVRYREGYVRGDLGRLDAQKLFVSAFFKKLSQKNDIVTAIQLVSSVLPETESDISLTECINIIGKIGVPDANNIKFMTLPGGDVRGSSGAWYYVMNRISAYKIINEYFNPHLLWTEFDKEKKFTSAVRSGFNAIYDAENGFEIKIYSAAEIDSTIEIESKYD